MECDPSFHLLDDAKARAVHLLTCPLCTKEYEDPRILPCQHTFCCRCLVAYVGHVMSASSTHRGAFSCPSCLADVGLPAAGASAFPVDQRIRNIRQLVVDEMVTDLKSRLKGRLHGDGMCNGGGGGVGVPGDEGHGHHGGARLGKINERPGVDDGNSSDAESGTWTSSPWTRRFGDESAHSAHQTPAPGDSAFSRQTPGYSSVGGASRTRRSRADAPPKRCDDPRFETPPFGDYGGSLSDTDTRFGRNQPGYFSMRSPRSRRSRMADGETHYDSVGVGRFEGRNMTSSDSFGNGQASPLTPETLRGNYQQRSASHVDVSTKSSPFDNINRDDDDFETYTPKIGRNRLAYSSLRGKKRYRHVPDAHQLFDSAADVVSEEPPSSDGSSRFVNLDSKVTYSYQSQTCGTSEFSETFHRTVSSDHSWTRNTSDHKAREQKLPEHSRTSEDGRRRTTSHQDAGKNRTDLHETRPQRPDNLDIAGLSVLSHLPASVKSPVRSPVSECAARSAADHSELRTQLDHTTDEVHHQTIVSASSSTSCAVDEVPSLSHTQNDVASQLNNLDNTCTGDVANSKHSGPTTSYSADSSEDGSVGKPDDALPYSRDCSKPATAGRSAESNDAVYQADILVDRQCSLSEEVIASPPCSPSYFSRLTKFRLSQNSRHAASPTSSSAVDSTSKEAVSPHSQLDSADVTSTVIPTAKSDVRKRPAVFVPTPFPQSFSASGSGESAVTSTPLVVGNDDELRSEPVSSNEEHPSERQLELHPASVSDGTVDHICNDGMSLDADVESGVQSVSSSYNTTNVEDAQISSSDVSPTAETTGTAESPPGTESDDIHTFVDDVSTAQQRHDEDSAVYSAGIDSDASVKSATEPCMPTPTTDDDISTDDVLLNAVDELVSPTLGDQQDGQTDVSSGLGDSGCGLTSSEGNPVDDVVTDFNVEHQDDVELASEVVESGTVENGGAKDDDSGSRSSACSASDELRYQHEQQPQTGDDGINEDDVVSNNKVAAEKDWNGETGFRTSQPSSQADDVIDDQSADGYVLSTGLAPLGDGSLVVADYGAGCVCLCDAEGRADHRVTGFKPFSVASTSMIAGDDDELIYVGDRRRKTLVVLDSHGSDVAQWPDNQFDWICGIACLPDGQLAVLDRSRTRQLGIYATSGDDGRALTELGGQGSSLGDLCMAEFVAADSRGRVLVTDSGNHCVKAFDHRVARPGVVAVYGTARGSGDAQLQWPKGVAVDSADNVLVADCRNGRVVSFSVDGRPLGSVVPTVRGPYAVCTLPTSLSNRRRLAVTTYSVSGLSEFRLYDYDVDAIFV